jgi:hypothetical protein
VSGGEERQKDKGKRQKGDGGRIQDSEVRIQGFPFGIPHSSFRILHSAFCIFFPRCYGGVGAVVHGMVEWEGVHYYPGEESGMKELT